MPLDLQLPNSPVQEASLSSLPVELHHLIYAHLNPVAKIALTITCRHFYRVFACQLPEWTNLAFDDKLALLTTFERDSNFTVKMAGCVVCKNCHVRSNFTPPELKKAEPRCWLYSTVAYFSPDHQYSFASQIKSYRECTDRTSPSGPVSIHTSGSGSHVRFSVDILTLPKNRIASKQHIGAILQNFNLPVCPHAWLSDPFFIQSYNPNNKVMIDIPLCDRYNSPSCCTVPTCNTSARWLVRTNPQRRFWKIIYIDATRHWGPGRDFPRDPFWTSQLITPNSDRLDRYWNERMEWKNEMMAREEKRYEIEEAQGVTGSGKDKGKGKGKNDGVAKAQQGTSFSIQQAASNLFNKISGTNDDSSVIIEEQDGGEARRKLSSYDYGDEEVLFWLFTPPKQLKSSAKFDKMFREANRKSWYTSLFWR